MSDSADCAAELILLKLNKDNCYVPRTQHEGLRQLLDFADIIRAEYAQHGPGTEDEIKHLAAQVDELLSLMPYMIEQMGIILAQAESECGIKHQAAFNKLEALRKRCISQKGERTNVQDKQSEVGTKTQGASEAEARTGDQAGS